MKDSHYVLYSALVNESSIATLGVEGQDQILISFILTDNDPLALDLPQYQRIGLGHLYLKIEVEEVLRSCT